MRAIDYFDKGTEANLDRTAMHRRQYGPIARCAPQRKTSLALSVRTDCEMNPAGIFVFHDEASILFCMLGIMRLRRRCGCQSITATPSTTLTWNLVNAFVVYHSQFRDSVNEIERHIVAEDLPRSRR